MKTEIVKNEKIGVYTFNIFKNGLLFISDGEGEVKLFLHSQEEAELVLEKIKLSLVEQEEFEPFEMDRESRFVFGKFIGFSIEEILERNPSYLQWCLNHKIIKVPEELQNTIFNSMEPTE